MTFSPQHLLPYLPSLPKAPPLPADSASLPSGAQPNWWVGFSGGLDSTVLLHALAQLQLPVRLCAVHINHQISPHAGQWQAHCAQVAQALGVAFYAERVAVNNTGKGLEDAARAARYRVFEACLAPGDYLLTAHHGDDQAETLLLRLMRGTGPRGLTAMAAQRPLGQGWLVRPLLPFTREQLEAYARLHGLVWVEDESNLSDHYDRNFLRNQVMPLLQGRWPGFTRKWQQTAELCATNEALLAEVAQEDLARLEERAEPLGRSLRLDLWLALSEPRRHNLLRYWLRQQGLAVPEQQHLQQLYRQLAAGSDAQVQINWEQVELRSYRQRCYVMVRGAQLADLRLLPASSGQGRLCADLPDLHIARRQGGERCKPAGRAHSQTLKKLLQEAGLEPWLREQLPLVFSGEQLVAVADLWVCDGYEASEGEAGYCLHWR